LEDTVGSNVITTSLACGLAQIVSDVGSIRDYCDETNTVFCKSTDEFVNALFRLNSDRNLVENMSRFALKQAESLSIKKFNEFFVELMS
jgi:glycosyltransferase involved in cell wall biosynthesis